MLGKFVVNERLVEAQYHNSKFTSKHHKLKAIIEFDGKGWNSNTEKDLKEDKSNETESLCSICDIIIKQFAQQWGSDRQNPSD